MPEVVPPIPDRTHVMEKPGYEYRIICATGEWLIGAGVHFRDARRARRNLARWDRAHGHGHHIERRVLSPWEASRG